MSALAGKRILVVEDEALIAVMVESMLVDLGASVIGPAGTIADAVALASNETIDAALLDVNIRAERVDPVADILIARGVPIVFATGYAEHGLPGITSVSILQKPYTQETLARTLAWALNGRSLRQ